VLALEDSELLAEREVLQDQVGPTGEDCEASPGDGQSVVEHPRTTTAVGTEGNQARPRALRVSRTGAHLVEGQGGRGRGEGQVIMRDSQTSFHRGSLPPRHSDAVRTGCGETEADSPVRAQLADSRRSGGPRSGHSAWPGPRLGRISSGVQGETMSVNHTAHTGRAR